MLHRRVRAACTATVATAALAPAGLTTGTVSADPAPRLPAVATTDARGLRRITGAGAGPGWSVPPWARPFSPSPDPGTTW
ncbi:hypothetical protein OH809_23405 [Streptomyces sp. NBC_00873]|uniref:hypothetical protein n=1 Tax=unclassified Streptomyces TaxID=2593676 RepID=UPI0038684B31|nr:hypothetical protein OH809_23405 [Streptomyces sp. NBC_00873]WTA44607.1 hypothetical protein OH821_19890 [Streptomyces sp. NBC_00842]